MSGAGQEHEKVAALEQPVMPPPSAGTVLPPEDKSLEFLSALRKFDNALTPEKIPELLEVLPKINDYKVDPASNLGKAAREVLQTISKACEELGTGDALRAKAQTDVLLENHFGIPRPEAAIQAASGLEALTPPASNAVSQPETERDVVARAQNAWGQLLQIPHDKWDHQLSTTSNQEAMLGIPKGGSATWTREQFEQRIALLTPALAQQNGDPLNLPETDLMNLQELRLSLFSCASKLLASQQGMESNRGLDQAIHDAIPSGQIRRERPPLSQEPSRANKVIWGLGQTCIAGMVGYMGFEILGKFAYQFQIGQLETAKFTARAAIREAANHWGQTGSMLGAALGGALGFLAMHGIYRSIVRRNRSNSPKQSAPHESN